MRSWQARNFQERGEYAKAEDYLTRATNRIYQIRGEKEKLVVERELAKVQEAQNKNK